jgi:hypothetical protein
MEAPALARSLARIAGVTDTQLRQNRLARITHGWYMDAADVADLAVRCRALAAVLPQDAVFSDTTAAAVYGVPLPSLAIAQDAPAHVTLTPRAVVPRRKELVVHQRALPDDRIRLVDGVRVTAPRRLYLDLAMSLGKEELAVVGDSLLNRELVTSAELADEVLGARRRRGLQLAREVLPLLDGRAQSPPETTVRIRLTEAGLPPEPQCPVMDQLGQVIGHTDLGYRRQRVAVEYEGRHHAEGEQFDYDIDRYSRFAAAGWLVIRCGRRDLAAGSSELIARVRAALATRPAGG